MKKEESSLWELRPGIKMDHDVLESVAQIACALKSLAAYTTFAIEREDCPDDLQKTVDTGLAAINKLFVA
ncbi:MAG: hypothetical protein HXY29_12000 [Rhodocyclaceae bacterium]|jgi:hypothetical protein|nr:hypothetical protein [Rhodocyclaceae bacterium]